MTNRGFTLVEIMIGASIGAFILTGVMTTFILTGKNGVNAANYVEMESDANKGLEIFAREIRMASSVSSPSTTSVTLGIPDATTSSTTAAYTVTYAFDSTNKKFTRTITSGTGPSSLPTGNLMSGVQSLTFKYYSYIASDGYINGSQIDNTISSPSSSISQIKQIELTLTAQRSSTTVVTATNNVLSARFILRNKP